MGGLLPSRRLLWVEIGLLRSNLKNRKMQSFKLSLLGSEETTEKIPPSFSEMSSGVVTRQKGI